MSKGCCIKVQSSVTDETITVIEVAPDGSFFTYTNESGAQITVPLSSGGGGDTSVVSDVNTAPSVKIIATHDDGTGNITNVEETVTALAAVPGQSNTWQYTDENGVVTEFAFTSCFAEWPTPVEYSEVISPGSAATYQIDGKITRVCVVNGLTGTQEEWHIRDDANGDPIWVFVA